MDEQPKQPEGGEYYKGIEAQTIGKYRDHCILRQAFITLSPIYDTFDNIENFFSIKQMIQL